MFVSGVFLRSGDYYIGSAGQAFSESKVLSVSGARLRDKPGRVDMVEAMVKAIQKQSEAGDAILCAPFSPGLYRLSARRNPLPLALFDRPEDMLGFPESQILDALAKVPPKVVVLEDFVADGKETNRFCLVAPSLYEWIMKNYFPAETIGAFGLYVPVS